MKLDSSTDQLKKLQLNVDAKLKLIDERLQDLENEYLLEVMKAGSNGHVDKRNYLKQKMANLKLYAEVLKSAKAYKG